MTHCPLLPAVRLEPFCVAFCAAAILSTASRPRVMQSAQSRPSRQPTRTMAKCDLCDAWPIGCRSSRLRVPPDWNSPLLKVSVPQMEVGRRRRLQISGAVSSVRVTLLVRCGIEVVPSLRATARRIAFSFHDEQAVYEGSVARSDKSVDFVGTFAARYFNSNMDMEEVLLQVRACASRASGMQAEGRVRTSCPLGALPGAAASTPDKQTRLLLCRTGPYACATSTRIRPSHASSR